MDDQPASIRILYQILESDYEVCVATTGREALAFCDTRPPDLILMDVVMPGMDGYEIGRRLRSNDLTKDIPIIFVTGQNDPLEEAEALDQGAADFISKPFHEKVVKARVRTQVTITRLTKALRSQALIDGLTGIANRRQFDITLAAEWRRCSRSQRALSLILIDIDYFKRFNDHYGHPAGDECIKAIATALKMNLQRSHDLAARYGGEEFACILPDTPLEGVRRKAVELEAAIRELGIPHEKSYVAGVVTISVGASVAIPAIGEDPTRLLAEADGRLYAAKHAGRGQVKVSLLNQTDPPPGSDTISTLANPSSAE